MSEIKSFKIEIAEEDINELRGRIESTRWPEKETVNDWSQGTPLSYMKEVSEYWIKNYNWKEREKYYNSFDQYITTIDELDIHFVHIKSEIENATPLIMSHGWPGSIVEFHKIIRPLVDPLNYGGEKEDAFHVVCPSLPGYGFSSKPSKNGTGVDKIAEIWNQLMNKIGYKNYFAQGGDWGSAITIAIGKQNRGNCLGLHVNMPFAPPTKEAIENPSERDKIAFEGLNYYQEWGSGYSKQQSTRPQTLGYSLVDSPIGQAAWIIEKFYGWFDGEDNKLVVSNEEVLAIVSLYWFTKSITSSARLYRENGDMGFSFEKITQPMAGAIFKRDLIAPPKVWAEQIYDVVQWNIYDGGHFAALEEPDALSEDIIKFVTKVVGS